MYPQDGLFHASVIYRKNDIYSYVIFHAQKLPKVIAEEAGIPAEGMAGLRLGAAGIIIVIMYNKKPTDALTSTSWGGRTSLKLTIL